jgi:hypothetical protein
LRTVGAIFLYLGVAVLGSLIGAIAVGVAGLLLGLLMARGYTRRGPSDPGDAPVYVAMGLTLFAAAAGAIIGFIAGVGWCVVLARRRRTSFRETFNEREN